MENNGVIDMAICMKCGILMNDKDISKHVCSPSDIPAEGSEKRFSRTDVSP